MDAYIGLLTFICAAVFFCRAFAVKPIPGLPVAGTKDPFLSIFSCINFLARAQQVMQESYIRFCDHHSVFQQRLIGEWRVVAIGQESIMAVLTSKSFPVLPFVAETCQLGLNIHPSLKHGADLNRPYIRKIMSELDDHFPQIISSIEISLKAEYINGAGRVNVMETMSHVVFRALNTIIVGPKLAGNLKYREQILRGVPCMFITGLLLKGVPRRLRYIVHKILTQVFPTCSVAQAMIIDEIKKKKVVSNLDQPWNPETSDILSWAAQHGKLADGEEVLAAHMILLNLAAVLTTTVTLTQTVIDLLTKPEYLEKIQSEVRTAMKDGLITVETLNQLPLLDSFMKESWRLMDTGAFHINRMAEVDATLPNGMTVPKGSIISIPTYLIHRSSKFYDDPSTFDATRFINNPRMKTGYLADVSPEYLFFGYGKIICPGRHIAIMLVKSVIVKMLLAYDIAPCNGTRILEPSWFGIFCLPDQRATVSLRERHWEEQ
jgi:cytochrome P450